MTPEKKTRNVVYRVCGSVILTCLVLAVIAGLVLSADVKAELSPLFWLESVAVLAFGVCWLVKGETLFGDRRPPRVEPARRGPTGRPRLIFEGARPPDLCAAGHLGMAGSVASIGSMFSIASLGASAPSARSSASAVAARSRAVLNRACSCPRSPPSDPARPPPLRR